MIDSERIFNAITSGNYPALAVEQGSELVDAWVAACVEEDKRYTTLLLEAGFFIELNENTFVVGAIDKIMRDSNGILAGEWKTSSKSRTWGPERWFDSLVNSHQIGTYSAALKYGLFPVSLEIAQMLGAPPDDNDGLWTPRLAEPRILARAVTKTKPPEIWPTPAGAEIKCPVARIEATLNAYRNEAAGIRAKRKTGVVPWQLPAKHCEKTYGFKVYTCEFLEECRALRFPVGAGAFEHGLSPGSSDVVKYLVDSGRISLDNATEVCILSSSSLEDAMQCSEKWRRRSIGQERESKESLEIGSVLHLGLKSYHEQLRENGY